MDDHQGKALGDIGQHDTATTWSGAVPADVAILGRLLQSWIHLQHCLPMLMSLGGCCGRAGLAAVAHHHC
jgi:hypothetical protein